MSEIFPKLKFLEANIKVELDLSNHATKADLKNAAVVDTSNIAKNIDLANSKPDVNKIDINQLKNIPKGLNSLKSKVDKLNFGKLETAPVDLSNLSDVVKDIINYLKKLMPFR